MAGHVPRRDLAGERESSTSAAGPAAGGPAPLASLAGRVELGGEVAVNRLGFGAMRLPGVWEEPQDPWQAHRLLRRAVELGVNLIDTAHAYGPETSERLIAEALHPYRQDLIVATKGGYGAAPGQPGTSLRPATGSDVPAVAALVDAAYGHYVERLGMPPRPMTDDYAAVIGDHQVTVAEHDGAIVGVVVLAVTDEGFLVDNVAVHPSRRGTGLGRALLQFAEREALRAGFDSVYLYTHEKMTENLALYSRIGYVEYDRRSQGAFSLVYMRKQLG